MEKFEKEEKEEKREKEEEKKEEKEKEKEKEEKEKEKEKEEKEKKEIEKKLKNIEKLKKLKKEKKEKEKKEKERKKKAFEYLNALKKNKKIKGFAGALEESEGMEASSKKEVRPPSEIPSVLALDSSEEEEKKNKKINEDYIKKGEKEARRMRDLPDLRFYLQQKRDKVLFREEDPIKIEAVCSFYQRSYTQYLSKHKEELGRIYVNGYQKTLDEYVPIKKERKDYLTGLSKFGHPDPIPPKKKKEKKEKNKMLVEHEKEIKEKLGGGLDLSSSSSYDIFPPLPPKKEKPKEEEPEEEEPEEEEPKEENEEFEESSPSPRSSSSSSLHSEVQKVIRFGYVPRDKKKFK